MTINPIKMTQYMKQFLTITTVTILLTACGGEGIQSESVNNERGHEEAGHSENEGETFFEH